MPETVRAELAVILAAGGGRRMGQPKGLLRLDGHPLVLHHVRALEPFATRIVVVVGARAEAHRAILRDVPSVENARWPTTWPSDSLALALHHDSAQTVLVQPVDTPPAVPDTLRALLGAGAPAVPRGPDGADGHPVLLGPTEIARVATGDVAGGLRSLLVDAPRVRVDQAHIDRDFDTVDAWRRFLRGDGDG